MSSNWAGQPSVKEATASAGPEQEKIDLVARWSAAYEQKFRDLESFDRATDRARVGEALAALLALVPDGPVKDALSVLLRDGLEPLLARRREGLLAEMKSHADSVERRARANAYTY